MLIKLEATKKRNRKGFILYIVICILLALAILAFALNNFKRGAVTQLAYNVDQNRLMLVAKSANTEVMAMIRSQVNLSPDSSIFKKFRSGFPGNGFGEDPTGRPITILSDYKPSETLSMAAESGYKIDVVSKAVLTYDFPAAYKSISAYNAHLDIYSKAWRKDSTKSCIEVYERHDVRLLDLRQNLDKYALFVKNYSPDMNNTQRRILIQGIEPRDGMITRVYLGNDNYPQKADPDSQIWMDICFDEINAMPGFEAIFGRKSLSAFVDNAGGDPCLFYANKVKFSDMELPKELFHHVSAVKKVYEDFVNNAADGCAGRKQDHKIGEELKAKCSASMPNTNNNAAAYRICKDYVDNFKIGTYDGKTVNDYSACENFNSILQTCMDNWYYHYGYLDADKIWDVAHTDRTDLPKAQSWITALAFKGLTEKNEDNDNMGPYFYGYYLKKDGKIYNPERFKVGRMIRLYGFDNKTPVLVEGPVNLRFFKLGFFNDFEKELTFYTVNHKIHPEPVPIFFRRYDLSETFQNIKVAKDFAPTDFFEDNYLMSRAVDTIPVNALLLGNGSNIQYYNGDGELKTLSKEDVYSDKFLRPSQKTGSAVAGKNFGRLIDYKNESYNYPSPTEFLADRVRVIDNHKTLCVDGLMYIDKGDMDLTDINYFYGKGLIYLATGNITFGNFQRMRDIEKGDSVRFYLRQGDIRLGADDTDITIEASLAALHNEVGSADPQKQGSLILNNKRNVSIYGNLIVDYLYTQDTSNNGLAQGGTLCIEHDPLIMEPGLVASGGKMDPYHVSIGRLKTAYAVKAAEVD